MSYKTLPKHFIDEPKELYYPYNSSHQPTFSNSQRIKQLKNSNGLLGGGQSTKPSSPNQSESEEPLVLGSEFKKPKKYSSDVSSTEEFHLESVKPKPKYFCSPEEKKRFVDDYTRKLKTEMCKNWTTTGQCRFGDKCSFAHGREQLQGKIHLHPNYKTKPCKKFFIKGVCSYGNRCQYIHTTTQLLEKGHSDFLKEIYPRKLFFDVPSRLNYLQQQLNIPNRLNCLADFSRRFYLTVLSHDNQKSYLNVSFQMKDIDSPKDMDDNDKAKEYNLVYLSNH